MLGTFLEASAQEQQPRSRFLLCLAALRRPVSVFFRHRPVFTSSMNPHEQGFKKIQDRRSCERMQSKNKEILVMGFALFAMFFGAGNVIFPPYIEIMGGND